MDDVGARPARDLRMGGLDGLRGTAAVAILILHVWLYTGPHAKESVVASAIHELRLAVPLFFVLSGFLLYRPWARAGLGARCAPDVGAYALRRAARVLPGYYLALAGTIVLLASVSDPRLASPVDVAPVCAFVQSFFWESSGPINTPMWTLAVEVAFYVVLPGVGWLALRQRSDLVGQLVPPLVLLGIGVAYNAVIAYQPPSAAATLSLAAMLPYFASGMLAAVLIEAGLMRPGIVLPLFAWGMLLVIGDGVWHELGEGTAHRILRDLPAGLGFAAVVAAVAAARRPIPLLDSAPARGLGTLSYGLYLWHMPLIIWLKANGLLPESTALALPVVLPLALAMAAVSWMAVERPAVAWAQRRSEPNKRRRTAVSREGALATSANRAAVHENPA